MDSASNEQTIVMSEQSEELRLAVLACLKLLFTTDQQSQQHTMKSTSTDNLHFMAYVVSALLHVAQNDRCRDAALLAMETLSLVVQFVNEPVLLRQFLPGITGGVWKCVNAPQQSSKVVVAAVHCLARVMRACLADEFAGKEDKPRAFTIDAIRELAQNRRVEDGTANDSSAAAETGDQWLSQTTVNMEIILSRIFSIGQRANHQASWRIRRALAELCGVVLLNCRSTLHDSFFRCFEELLVYQVDVIPEVVTAARKVSTKLHHALGVDEWLEMLSTFADRFDMQLSTLVLRCATEHEAFSVHVMKKMIGYLSFLGGRLQPYLDRGMESTYKSLCRVFEVETMDIDLVVHQTLHSRDGSSSEPLTVSHFQKRFKHFHDQETVDAAIELLHAIGAVCTPAVFIDCAFALIDEADSASSSGGEVVLVLNELLRGCGETRRESTNENLNHVKSALTELDERRSWRIDVHLVGRVLEDLLVLDAWNEQAEAANESKVLANQRALMVECIGICAEILGHEFAVFLLHVLYPLVEKLGSRSVQVEREAIAALAKIYYFCGYDSMEELFEANMDYFVDALCSRLEHLDEYPLTALVIEGLLQHTRITSLPLADEVTHSLLRSVDMYQESPYIDGLLRALQLLLRSISKESAPSEEREDAQRDEKLIDVPDRPLLRRFLAEVKAFTSDDDDDEDSTLNEREERFEEIKDGDDTVNPTPSIKGAMPLEYDETNSAHGDGNDSDDEQDDSTVDPVYRALTVEILDRSGYFVATPDPMACCQVLSLMEEGFLLLKRSQKQLLPLIHRLWSALLPRLHAESRAIVTAAAQVVATLSTIAGDFIASRFVEDIWPVFRSRLASINVDVTAPKLTRSMLLLSPQQDADVESDQAAAVSPNIADTGSTVLGRKTQEIRLLLAILSCLTTVSTHTDAVSQIVPEVLASCSKFLDRSVPAEIVETTSKLLVALYRLNGDEVFCAVAALADWEPPRPPSARFPTFATDTTRLFYRSHLRSFPGVVGNGCAVNASRVMRSLIDE